MPSAAGDRHPVGDGAGLSPDYISCAPRCSNISIKQTSPSSNPAAAPSSVTAAPASPTPPTPSMACSTPRAASPPAILPAWPPHHRQRRRRACSAAARTRLPSPAVHHRHPHRTPGRVPVPDRARRFHRLPTRRFIGLLDVSFHQGRNGRRVNADPLTAGSDPPELDDRSRGQNTTTRRKSTFTQVRKPINDHARSRDLFTLRLVYGGG